MSSLGNNRGTGNTQTTNHFADASHFVNRNSGFVSWNTIISNIHNMSYLQNDWDGEGSPAPTEDVIQEAIRLALHFKSECDEAADIVHAGFNGSIFFEWHTPSHYRELEVRGQNQIFEKNILISEVSAN